MCIDWPSGLLVWASMMWVKAASHGEDRGFESHLGYPFKKPKCQLGAIGGQKARGQGIRSQKLKPESQMPKPEGSSQNQKAEARIEKLRT